MQYCNFLILFYYRHFPPVGIRLANNYLANNYRCPAGKDYTQKREIQTMLSILLVIIGLVVIFCLSVFVVYLLSMSREIQLPDIEDIE